MEADVWLDSGVFGRASVPSGASVGSHEAVVICDEGDEYCGLSMYNSVTTITHLISPHLKGMPADDQAAIDQALIDLDGTPNKSKLGASAILAVSLATAHAAAKARDILLYSHIADIAGTAKHKSLPMPMMNLLNGGKHALHSTDIQESMIIPVAATSLAGAVRIGAEVFYALKNVIKRHNYATTVGDEGGFAPNVSGNHEAMELLIAAIEEAGYQPGVDIMFALDVASSELHTEKGYYFPAEKKLFQSPELIDWYTDLCCRYPIVSIEDGMAEDDWIGWRLLGEKLDQLQLVGDDLLVTNTSRIKQAIHANAANAILIKPNQVGTLSETLAAIKMAHQQGWQTIISHRSGETEDTTIAHIAVGTGAGQIKIGSLSRSERVAKYNELMRIEGMDPTLRLNKPSFTSICTFDKK